MLLPPSDLLSVYDCVVWWSTSSSCAIEKITNYYSPRSWAEWIRLLEEGERERKKKFEVKEEKKNWSGIYYSVLEFMSCANTETLTAAHRIQLLYCWLLCVFEAIKNNFFCCCCCTSLTQHGCSSCSVSKLHPSNMIAFTSHPFSPSSSFSCVRREVLCREKKFNMFIWNCLIIYQTIFSSTDTFHTTFVRLAIFLRERCEQELQRMWEFI